MLRVKLLYDWTTKTYIGKLDHDDVIKWKHFPHYWPFVRGIHRSPVNSPHKGQRRGALMFSLICSWINHWANNGEAGDLRRYWANNDVTVMFRVFLMSFGRISHNAQGPNIGSCNVWVSNKPLFETIMASSNDIHASLCVDELISYPPRFIIQLMATFLYLMIWYGLPFAKWCGKLMIIDMVRWQMQLRVKQWETYYSDIYMNIYILQHHVIGNRW